MSDARRAFPVFDKPSDKIPFQLTITAPKDQKVYANTPELKTIIVGDMATHHFDKTPPISSYLVALAVGPFVETKVDGMPIEGRIITSKEKQKLAQYAADEIPAILASMKDYFGSPYPYKKLDSVGVPEFPFGAMENAGKDVPSVLKSFIEQSSFPLVAVKQNGKTISLSQSRFANKGVDAPAQLWSVPVTIKYGRGNEVKEAKFLLNSDLAKIDLDFEPEWIYPDANAMGYYRWMLEDKQLDTLLTNAADVLTVREGRAFISASDALLDSGLMSVVTCLKL